MLRDRLVVGIHNLGLTEKIQTDPDLTMEKAKGRKRQPKSTNASYREMARWHLTGFGKGALVRIPRAVTDHETAVHPVHNAPGVVVVSMQLETDVQLQELPATSVTGNVICCPVFL